MLSQGPSGNSSLVGQTNLNVYILSVLLASLALIIIIQRKWRMLKSKQSKNGKGELGEGHPDLDNLPGLEAIPQPWTWDPTGMIGNALDFLPFQGALKAAVKLSHRHGDVFKITALADTYVGVNSASVAQSLLRSSEMGHLTKAPEVYDPLKPMTTNGVLVSTGQLWQHERKILMKSQTYQSLKAYMPMLNRHFKQFVSRLESLFKNGEESHPINDLIFSCFLKVINEKITGFRTDRYDHDEFVKYNDNIKRWKECLPYRFLPPWILFTPLWKLHPLSRKYDKASDELLKFARRRLREFKESRIQLETSKELEGKGKGEEVVGNSKPEFRSVLDELVDAGVEDEQIVAEINAMIFGGYETGATAIYFFFFCMALNPEIQKNCQKEIDEMFEDPQCYTNGTLTFEAVSSGLKLVERCILETLRLFPPVYVYTRKLEQHLKISCDGQDVVLPIGTKVVVSPFIIHRKLEYFPEPEKFDPDRFLPEESAKRHPYAFIPFSGGPRNCLGMKFAMLEMKTIAAYTLRHFVLKTKDRMEDIPLLPFTILTPAKDYTFQLTKRENKI